MTDSSAGHLRFRPDIEGLRAVAIIAVVLYHANWSGARGGFFGVDVFFVLSGFLICGIIVDEIAKTGTLSLVHFWARRALRLLPAATCITLVVLAINTRVLSLAPQVHFGDTARAFAVYGSNILFAVRSTDYFGGIATRDPLLHTWSLSVEEQFYVLFAPAMLLLAVVARKYGTGTFRRWLVWLAVTLSALSLVGCIILVRRYPTIAFYALPARAWEFGLGAMAVLATRYVPRLGARFLEAIALVSFTALVASVALLHENRVQPLGFASLLPTMATVGLLLSGAGTSQTLIARALSTAPMRMLGRLSYSWYLWHWPALTWLRTVRFSPSTGETVLVAVLSLIPAAAVYVWIESPIRYSGYLKRRPRLTLAGAVMLAVLTLGAATGARSHANSVLKSPRVVKYLAASALPRIYADGCQLSPLQVSSPACIYGPGTNDTTLVLFGDSHAAHWFPAFDSIATLRGWKLINWTKTGCPSSSVSVTNLGRQYFECDEWRKSTIERIVALNPTIVVIVNDKTYKVLLGDEQILVDSSAVGRSAWRQGLIVTMTALAPSGAKLVLLGDTPQPSSDVPQCLTKNLDDPAECDVSATLGLNPPVTAMERDAVQSVRNVAYINLNAFICDSIVCPAMRDGIVRYQDSNHLSVIFAASLAPQLSDALTAALGVPGAKP